MKYILPTINLKDYKISCNSNEHVTFNNCIKCKADYIECWKNTIVKNINSDCRARNIIKYLYSVNKHCSLCNKKITDIEWSEKSIKLFCHYCNSAREEITQKEIQITLREQYEYIDENELNHIIENSLNNTIITNPDEINKRNCALCNKKFTPYDKWRKKDMLCIDCQSKNT